MAGPREHCPGTIRAASVTGPTVRFRPERARSRGRRAPRRLRARSAPRSLRPHSPKDGCAPQGQCGCCLALVDGHPRVTCAMSARRRRARPRDARRAAAGRASALGRRVRRAARLQCGFCIPGIVMRGKAILDKNAEPLAQGDRQAPRRAPVSLHRVHEDPRRHRARRAGEARRMRRCRSSRRTGTSARASRATRGSISRWAIARTSTTCVCPTCSKAAVLQSEHARATIRAIDTSEAERLPGVIAVVTAKDVPGQNRVGIFYEDWPPFIGVGMTTSMVGDVIAAVAAVDEHTARAAAKLVKVDYEVHTPIVDPEASIAAGRAAHQPDARERARSLGHQARRRRRRARGVRARRLGHVADAADRAPLPRARVLRRVPDGEGREALHAGPGHLRRPAPGGEVPRAPRGRRRGGARPQRRRVRRQRGHVDPGADVAPRARHGARREARAHARRERSASTRSATRSRCTTPSRRRRAAASSR